MYVKSKRSLRAVRPTKVQQSEATKRTLERVGRELFATRGFAGVSAEQLVARAKVTRGALYHHYDGKPGLFAAIVEGEMRKLHGRLVTEAARSSEPIARLERGVDAFLRACAEPDTQRILLIDAPAVLGWPAWREMDAKYGLGLLKRGLSAAMAAGEISRQDPDVLAHVLLGAMTEAAMLVARSKRPEETKRAAGRAIVSMIESWKVAGRT
jgi:AcrR family transcriptional regulator